MTKYPSIIGDDGVVGDLQFLTSSNKLSAERNRQNINFCSAWPSSRSSTANNFLSPKNHFPFLDYLHVFHPQRLFDSNFALPERTFGCVLGDLTQKNFYQF